MKQKRWNWFVAFFFAAALLGFSGCGGGGGDSAYHPPPPPPSLAGTIELRNYSDVVIDGFYLSPVYQTLWGPDILAGLLYPGENLLVLDIGSGYYDAKITATGLYSEYCGYLYDFPVNAGENIRLDVYNSSFTGSLELRNDTLASIIGVYVVPADAPTWGVNQISSPIGPSGVLHLFDLDPDLYDVMIVWDIGPDSIYYDISIESLTLTALDVD
jgi:hypothetical protein